MPVSAPAPRVVWREPHVRLPAKQHRHLALLALAGVLALGCTLRLIGLDRASLSDDELNHYFVARSIQQGHDPVLPSGEWYLRGYGYTRSVAFLLDRVQPLESAVRLPSALLGCLGLVAFALIAWKLAGPWAGVYAALLLAVFPYAIYLSRTGRFYTMQLVFGLVAFYAGWRALGGGSPRLRAHRSFVSQWGWVLVTAAAFLLATRVQVVTLSVVFACGVAMLAVAIMDIRAWRRDALRWSAALQLTTATTVAAGLWLVARPETLPDILVRATSVPYWASVVGYDSTFYLRFLTASLPLVIAAGAAAFFRVVRRRGALGWYLLVWFGLPLLLHSLLPWRNGRFILLVLPALLLAFAIAAADLLAGLHTFVTDRMAGPRRGRYARRFAAHGLVVVLALGTLTTPAVVMGAMWPVGAGEARGWREVLEIASALPGSESIPLGHSLSLPAFHYLGRLDFTPNEALREQWLTRERKRASMGVDEPGGYVWLPMGAPDLYTGAPVLTTPAAIREHFTSAGAVLIGLQSRMPVLGLRPELYETLELEATELCQGQCGPMLLYYWRFGGEAERPTEGVRG